MALSKTVSEIIDAVVIAIFIIIFLTVLGPYIQTIILTPSANTLANFIRVVQDAYAGNEARYPLILNEDNQYTLFGTGLYIIQVKNNTAMPSTRTSKPISESCAKTRTCLCVMTVYDCEQDPINEYQGNWKKIPVFGNQYFEDEDTKTLIDPLEIQVNDLFNLDFELSSVDDALVDFTNEIVKYEDCLESSYLDEPPRFLAEIINCEQTHDDTNLVLTRRGSPLILFPTREISTTNKVIDIIMTKESDNSVSIENSASRGGQ